MIYLVNSSVYEVMYGWPQRLHPCPQLLHPQARLIAEGLVHRTAPLLGNWTDPLGVVNALGGPQRIDAVVNAAERRFSDSITSFISHLRGADDRYCSTDPITGNVTCTGLCFTSERPNVEILEDASCLLRHDCTPVPQGKRRMDLVVPPSAWAQFLHYGAITVGVTWALAWALFTFVEVPVLTALFQPAVKRVLFWPVIAHAVVVMVYTVPVVILTNVAVMANVTPTLEHQLMHKHLD
jgi:hypothetical protein